MKEYLNKNTYCDSSNYNQVLEDTWYNIEGVNYDYRILQLYNTIIGPK